MRRGHKWSARRIALELAAEGVLIAVRTVSRHLAHLGLNRRRFLDPTGENNRQPARIHARWPGHTVHLDVKVGIIPDGGGWRVHGRGTEQANSPFEAANAAAGPLHLPAHRDRRLLRLAYTEALPDEQARTAIATPYTPRHNGKVERYHRILAEELLYAHTWTSEHHRTETLQIWNLHYNHHRPPTAADDQPSASRLHTGVTDAMASYS